MAVAPGATDLTTLISSMSPSLDPTGTVYVFAHLPLQHTARLTSLFQKEAELGVKMIFKESEAWTVILSKTAAEREGLEFSFPSKMITLNIHSSLDAVGFLAAVTTRLAERLNTGVNPVSGYFHDHLFVPEGLEDNVVEELKMMAAGKR